MAQKDPQAHKDILCLKCLRPGRPPSWRGTRRELAGMLQAEHNTSLPQSQLVCDPATLPGQDSAHTSCAECRTASLCVLSPAVAVRRVLAAASREEGPAPAVAPAASTSSCTAPRRAPQSAPAQTDRHRIRRRYEHTQRCCDRRLLTQMFVETCSRLFNCSRMALACRMPVKWTGVEAESTETRSRGSTWPISETFRDVQ